MHKILNGVLQFQERVFPENRLMFEHLAAKQLTLNEIGVCNLSLDQPVAFDAYTDNREMGGFILIDRLSNHTTEHCEVVCVNVT